MHPERLMTIPCTVTSMVPGDVDEYNDEVLEPGTPVETTCWLHQTQRSEITVDANTAIETWTLYLPPDVELSSVDQVTVGEATFEVVGPPHRWLHPRTQRATYIEATLRVVDVDVVVGS